MDKEHNEEGAVVNVGKFISPHGVAGLIKVFPYSDNPDRCQMLKEVNVNLKGERRRVIVEKASVYGRFWLLALQGVTTREQAAELTGGLLEIPAAERMILPPGSYYHDQVIGLQVYSTENELLGKIVDIISHGGHDLYMMKRAAREGISGQELPIPAVKEFVKEIDLRAGHMVVDLPEGMDEL